MSDRPIIFAQLDAIEAMVRSVRAALADPEPADELLDLAAITANYGWKRDALLNAERRGEITLRRGVRRKITALRSDLDALRRLPRAPTKARKVATVVDLAEWDREAESELRAMGGRR